MPQGIKRSQILKKLPKLKPGSFELFAARAGIRAIGKEPCPEHPHLYAFIYPIDSVERIKKEMEKKGT